MVAALSFFLFQREKICYNMGTKEEEEKEMKKLVILLLVFICGLLLFRGVSEKKDETKADLEKIEQVQAVCEKVATSNAVYSFGQELNKWYIYDLELMLKEGNLANKVFINELGSDFSTKLSNNDRLFVGFMPALGKYRIYAGDPNRAETMIYPEWEYKKVKPEE